MHFLKRVEVTGLWGSRNFSFSLYKDVNILKGKNGTGKTTLIKLIAAAMKLNVRELLKIEFDSIMLTFHPRYGNKTPSIKISKIVEDDNVKISCLAKEQRKNVDKEILLYDERAFRSRNFFLKDTIRSDRRDILNKVYSIVTSIWLPIERRAEPQEESEKKFNSTVDQNIFELERKFMEYELSLKSKETQEQHKFQKDFFLSILNIPSWTKTFSKISNVNSKTMRGSMEEIYDQLMILDEVSIGKLDKFFENLNKALQHGKDDKALKVDDVLLFSYFWNILTIKEKWDQVRNDIATIYLRREIFFNTYNSLIHYKKITIDSGKIFALTDSQKRLELEQLSSGEKQMFILLATPFFMGENPIVYIADEPELSLHIEWQESLISNIRKVNNSVQVLFATHSPDIVSKYTDSIFDMEKILNGEYS